MLTDSFVSCFKLNSECNYSIFCFVSLLSICQIEIRPMSKKKQKTHTHIRIQQQINLVFINCAYLTVRFFFFFDGFIEIKILRIREIYYFLLFLIEQFKRRLYLEYPACSSVLESHASFFFSFNNQSLNV